jgi:hypothetical protein
VKLRILLIPFVVVLLATACADTTSTALKVGDESFSRGDVIGMLTDLADDIAENPELSARFDVEGGTMPATLGVVLLQQVILNVSNQQLLEADGLDVGAAEIDRLLADAAPTGSETIDLLLAETNARIFAAEAAGLDWRANASQITVELDPRFGRWESETLIVVGPGGLQPSS